MSATKHSAASAQSQSSRNALVDNHPHETITNVGALLHFINESIVALDGRMSSEAANGIQLALYMATDALGYEGERLKGVQA